MLEGERVETLEQIHLRDGAVAGPVARIDGQQLLERGGSRVELPLLQPQKTLFQVEIGLHLLEHRRRGGHTPVGHGELQLLVRFLQQALRPVRSRQQDSKLGAGGIDPASLEQRRQRVIETAAVEIRAAQGDVRVHHGRSGLNNPLQLLNGFGALPEVEEGQAEIVTGLREGRIGLQRLPVDLHRAAWIPELSFRFPQQREKLSLPRGFCQSGFQLLACARGPAQLEIGIGQVEARRSEIGIERQRLPELRNGFPHEIRRAHASVGDSQKQMPLRRSRIEGQDGFELEDRFLGTVCPGKESGPDAVQPLLNRGFWGVSLRSGPHPARFHRRARHDAGKQHDAEPVVAHERQAGILSSPARFLPSAARPVSPSIRPVAPNR